MTDQYLNSDSVLWALRYLRDKNIKSVKIFDDFLLLKFVGVDKQKWTENDDNFKEEASKGAKYLMSIFSPDENLPEKYEAIDPFHMKWSVSESSKKYGRTRLWNNVAAGGKNWRGLVDTQIEPNKIRFKIDYIEKLMELCQLHHEKISLTAISIWVARFSNLNLQDNAKAKNTIIKSFIQLFNITDEEKRALFIDDSQMVELNNFRINAELIRGEIGEPPTPFVFTQEINDYPIEEGIIMTDEIVRIKSKNPDIEEIYSALNKVNQIILYGPPGTGKTYYAKSIADKYFNPNMLFIQLHQNYTYEDFIGGYKIVDGVPAYKDGIFVQILKDAIKYPNKNYLIVIDEINRANLSKVFGEVFVCLDRDYGEVTLGSNNEKISIPDNLFIIGTMNSSDRSIALVDIALRRRFRFIYLHPDEELLANVTNDSSLENIKIVSIFNKLNDKIVQVLQNRDIIFGQTFFMPKRLLLENKFIWNLEDLEFEFNYVIIPMLEEYCYGNEGALIEIVGEKLASRLKADDFKDAMIEYLS